MCDSLSRPVLLTFGNDTLLHQNWWSHLYRAVTTEPRSQLATLTLETRCP